MALRRIKISVGEVRVGSKVVVGIKGLPFEGTRYCVFWSGIVGAQLLECC